MSELRPSRTFADADELAQSGRSFILKWMSAIDPLRTFLTDDYKSLWAFREAVTAATCG